MKNLLKKIIITKRVKLTYKTAIAIINLKNWICNSPLVCNPFNLNNNNSNTVKYRISQQYFNLKSKVMKIYRKLTYNNQNQSLTLINKKVIIHFLKKILISIIKKHFKKVLNKIKE
jgi:hypothetical protein